MKLLHKPLAAMSINYTAPNTWEHIGSTGQKTRVLISTGTYFVAAQDTYFDLAGLSQQEKTIFFQSLSSQQYSIKFFRGAAVGDSYVELLLYSAVPINDTDLITVFAGGPGGQFTNTNWEQIPYWRTANAYIGLDQGGYQQLIHQAVNVGGSGAICDAFIETASKCGPNDLVGGVGACKVTECKFNDCLECSAPGINIKWNGSNAMCNTFKRR